MTIHVQWTDQLFKNCLTETKSDTETSKIKPNRWYALNRLLAQVKSTLVHNKARFWLDINCASRLMLYLWSMIIVSIIKLP